MDIYCAMARQLVVPHMRNCFKPLAQHTAEGTDRQHSTCRI
nr:MAG TPA: hypothetical protein [Caudoviricetes sp.]